MNKHLSQLFLAFGLVFMLSSMNSIHAQDKKTGEFSLSVSAHNQWYWRGYTVGPDPLVAAMATYSIGGFTFGTWNGMGVNGIWKDVDLFISYTTDFGLSIALWDIFNYSDYSKGSAAEVGFGDNSSAKYFNYDPASEGGTRHFFDLSLNYAIPESGWNLFYATIIAGRDVNSEGKQALSSYFKTSYTGDVKGIKVTPYASVSWAYNDNDESFTFYDWTAHADKTKNFGFSEIGVNLSKSVKITDSYSLGFSGGVVASPRNDTMTGLLGVTLSGL